MGRSLLILLDTHVVLWLTSDPNRLSAKAKTAIEDSRTNRDGLAICDMTLLELATLASKGRIQVSIGLEALFQELESRFVVLPISGRACARAMAFPATYPKDPADRIIGATALVEGLSLVTADRQIQRSKLVPTIW
jgi:PIN domain nuclease of toxin-antitoxin system